jgi:hypothetical protein
MCKTRISLCSHCGRESASELLVVLLSCLGDTGLLREGLSQHSELIVQAALCIRSQPISLHAKRSLPAYLLDTSSLPRKACPHASWILPTCQEKSACIWFSLTSKACRGLEHLTPGRRYWSAPLTPFYYSSATGLDHPFSLRMIFDYVHISFIKVHCHPDNADFHTAFIQTCVSLPQIRRLTNDLYPNAEHQVHSGEDFIMSEVISACSTAIIERLSCGHVREGPLPDDSPRGRDPSFRDIEWESEAYMRITDQATF